MGLLTRDRILIRNNGNFLAPLPCDRMAIVVLEQEFVGISLPEHDGLELRPNLLIAPMLAQDVGWVTATDEVS